MAGFVFSDSESTALEQFEGGPCAVIAPVQVRLFLYYRNGLKSVSPKFVLYLFVAKINMKKIADQLYFDFIIKMWRRQNLCKKAGMDTS